MIKRRRVKQTSTLVERLLYDKQDLREQATKLPPGRALDEVNRRIRRNETAAHISEWLDSPGLRAPR